MRIQHIFNLFVPALVLSCGNGHKPGIDESISLVHKSVKGETWSVTTEWNEKISSTDSTGSTQQREIKMGNVMDYVVEAVDARGVATIRGKYVSMRTNDFDSKDSSTYKDTTMARIYRNLSLKTFTLKVDTLGNVLKVTGAEGFYSMGNPDAVMDENKMMREMVQNALAIFPGKKVKKADTWEKTNTLTYGYPGIYKHTYTLKDVKDGVATIEDEAEVRPNFQAPPTYFPGNLIVRMELYGTQNGMITVDIAKGKITKTEQTLKINGKARGAVDGKAFENVFSTELKTRMEVKFGNP